MMHKDAYDVLRQLHERGMDVALDDGVIWVRPAEKLTDDLRAMIAQNRDDIAAILQSEPCPPPSRYSREFAGLLSRIPDAKKRAELRARFEGRAGVFAWSRGLPWDEADRLALESLRAEAGKAGANPGMGDNGP